jgi:hypothetical protein
MTKEGFKKIETAETEKRPENEGAKFSPEDYLKTGYQFLASSSKHLKELGLVYIKEAAKRLGKEAKDLLPKEEELKEDKNKTLKWTPEQRREFLNGMIKSEEKKLNKDNNPVHLDIIKAYRREIEEIAKKESEL